MDAEIQAYMDEAEGFTSEELVGDEIAQRVSKKDILAIMKLTLKDFFYDDPHRR